MPSGLFILLDDITALLDDVSVMTKIATKKTAGVLGDDLALNAQQVSGVKPDRELPVVWAVAKGSLINKAILVPAALAISALIHWAVTPLLMVGGAYLCFEGAEKLVHKFLHKQEAEAHQVEHVKAVADEQIDLVALEKDKIKGAIRTDFILSAEIIVITLGTVSEANFGRQVAVLCAIGLIMTVGVYGLVAGIVKLDDAGLYLSKKRGVAKAFGRGLLVAAPALMKFLSVAGTAAMFMVGGGILTHSIKAIDKFIDRLTPKGALGAVLSTVGDALTGLIVGLVLVFLVLAIKKLRGGGENKSAA